MPWPDRAESASVDAQPLLENPSPAAYAQAVVRPLSGGIASTGAAYAIDIDALDDGVQSDPGSASGWHRIERTGGWHAIVGGPITLRGNDLVFISRNSVIRFIFYMPAGQPARDVWQAVAWQFGNSSTGAIYTLGRPAFTDSGWRARRSMFLNSIATMGGDFWLDTTGGDTGAAYDSWADPELGDGCTIKLGAMTGVGVFDQVRLWMRAGCYNATVGPTTKELYYLLTPPSARPRPGTRIFVVPGIAPLRDSQCE